MSFSYTKTSTFTIVHARYLASKVAADMHLCAMYYGEPSEEMIRNYAEELAQYLNEGVLGLLGMKREQPYVVVVWRLASRIVELVEKYEVVPRVPPDANGLGPTFMEESP